MNPRLLRKPKRDVSKGQLHLLIRVILEGRAGVDFGSGISVKRYTSSGSSDYGNEETGNLEHTIMTIYWLTHWPGISWQIPPIEGTYTSCVVGNDSFWPLREWYLDQVSSYLELLQSYYWNWLIPFGEPIHGYNAVGDQRIIDEMTGQNQDMHRQFSLHCGLVWGSVG